MQSDAQHSAVLQFCPLKHESMRTCVMETVDELSKPWPVFFGVTQQVQDVIRQTATVAHALRPCCYHCPDVNLQSLKLLLQKINNKQAPC